MRTVKEIMNTDVVTLRPESDINEAIRLILKRRINGVPVVDEENQVVGILCQSDLIAQQKKLPVPSYFTVLDSFIPFITTKELQREVRKVAASTVADAMTPDPVTIAPDDEISAAATLMVSKNYHTLPVVENGQLVGILGKEDMLKTLIDESNAS